LFKLKYNQVNADHHHAYKKTLMQHQGFFVSTLFLF